MPRINDAALECVIYLYRSRHEADEGINIGGSGFLVSVKAEKLSPPSGFIYAVTNAHVIEAGAVCVRLNTAEGAHDVLEYKRTDWFCSETDDLAVCELPNLAAYSVAVIPTEQFLTEAEARVHDIGIGDSVIAIGRFINHEGKQRNRPMVRFGNISQVPNEPIQYRIGSKLHEQESYFADIKSIGGYSGSPVIVLPDPFDIRKGAVLPKEKQNPLLGVDWGHILDWQPVCDRDRKPLDYGMQVEANTGMMGIVPAWKLEALLRQPKLVERRAEEEESEYQGRTSPMAGANAPAHSASDENPNGAAP